MTLYDAMRKRGAYIDQYRREQMFSESLDEFDHARCVLWPRRAVCGAGGGKECVCVWEWSVCVCVCMTPADLRQRGGGVAHRGVQGGGAGGLSSVGRGAARAGRRRHARCRRQAGAQVRRVPLALCRIRLLVN